MELQLHFFRILYQCTVSGGTGMYLKWDFGYLELAFFSLTYKIFGKKLKICLVQFFFSPETRVSVTRFHH